MALTVPAALRHAVAGDPGGQAWLDTLPDRAARATERWGLRLGEPFGSGRASWTAPAVSRGARAVVLKLSYPHREARHEGAALTAWAGRGAVGLLDADVADWALLLPLLRPGTALRDAGLPRDEHLAVGAELLSLMAAVPAGPPFDDLAEVGHDLAALAEDRLERLVVGAPVPLDVGLCRRAVDLLRTLPGQATRRGLLHGDLNPGNVLRAAGSWVAIDPKPLHGDLAWDPWPLLTQLGDWTAIIPPPAELAERARLVADLTGLDPARLAAWCLARGVESALWAADRGWWSGYRGADGDLARSGAWAAATELLGG